jgi:glyceraldehyde-3-phosphate dehydrogenase (ferredoxin)
MNYGTDFLPPRELGRINAERFIMELNMDNLGICRFHRNWAEEMLPEIVQSLYSMKEEYVKNLSATASRVNSRNSSVFWESGRNIDIIYSFLIRKRDVDGEDDSELMKWINMFKKDKREAAVNFWYEVRKGIDESLTEF